MTGPSWGSEVYYTLHPKAKGSPFQTHCEFCEFAFSASTVIIKCFPKYSSRGTKFYGGQEKVGAKLYCEAAFAASFCAGIVSSVSRELPRITLYVTHLPSVILSPSDNAIPCVLLRMRTCP